MGFVEVSAESGSKYGMGAGVPLADRRPMVLNLAVDPKARRCGIGSALMDACEDMVRVWNYDEVVLQVRSLASSLAAEILAPPVLIGLSQGGRVSRVIAFGIVRVRPVARRDRALG